MLAANCACWQENTDGWGNTSAVIIKREGGVSAPLNSVVSYGLAKDTPGAARTDPAGGVSAEP